MKKEKMWNFIGFIFGIIIIGIGIWFINSPPMSFLGVSVEDRTFGGDFYTYEYEATQAAAINARVTALHVGNLIKQLALYVGAFFAVVGGLVVLNYGKRLFAAHDNPTLVNGLSTFQQKNDNELKID